MARLASSLPTLPFHKLTILLPPLHLNMSLQVPPFHTHPDESRWLVWCFYHSPSISTHQTSQPGSSGVLIATPPSSHTQTSHCGSSGVVVANPAPPHSQTSHDGSSGIIIPSLTLYSPFYTPFFNHERDDLFGVVVTPCPEPS
jgi:hypothetical protein